MKRSFDSTVKNLLRSGQVFYQLRRRLVGEFLKAPGQRLEITSTFLIASLLQIKRNTEWLGLRFTDSDWDTLKKLRDVAAGSAVEDNLLNLTVAYIAANIPRVEAVRALDETASALIIEGRQDAVEAEIKKLGKTDQQSLLVFKLVSSVNAASHDYIAQYFFRNIHSNWVRQRFVYPLIFFSINRLDAASLDQTLVSIFPWLESYPEERCIVRFLLRSDFEHGDTLSFKCYASLMAHPADALRMLVEHLESKISSMNPLTESEAEALTVLAGLFPGSRIESLHNVSSRMPRKWLSEGTGLRIDFPISPTDTRFFEGFYDLSCHVSIPHGSKILSALGRMRWDRYPRLEDFEVVVSVTSQYGFLALGRLLDVSLMSLYMVTRRTAAEERRFLIRCAHLFSGSTPFLMTSPRAASELASGFLMLDASSAQIKLDVEKSPTSSADRTWMKTFHWNVHPYEQRLKLSDYFTAVRANMRPSVNSRFLSGVDWRWIQEVMDALRIEPFRTPEAIYTLFLKAIEEREAHPNYLRIALRPLVNKMESVADFVQYLIGEYGQDAMAMIFATLTPDMILKLQLENYYAAALAERLDALTRCVEHFGFNEDMLTEEQYLAEQKTLTTALMLMNVHSAQFAVSWEAIRSTAVANGTEIYAAFEAVNRTFNEIALLSDALRTSPLKFANRQNVVYTLKNRLWPAAAIVEKVIDAFLSHPSHGIESILAVRIRHDNLRYEFGLVVESTKKRGIPLVREADKELLIPDFDAAITEVINRWVDRYMHTAPAPERKAIFDFVPSEKELLQFIEPAGQADALGEIVDRVIRWLQDRLAAHLHTARQLLDVELRQDIQHALDAAEKSLKAAGAVSPDRISRVRKALWTALELRCDQLREWFESPVHGPKEAFSLDDIKLAIDGRFRSEIEGGKLQIELTSTKDTIKMVAADSVRLVFDIWSELARNAMKYSGRSCARLRVWSRRSNDASGLFFSSLNAEESVPWVKEFTGEPTVSTSSAIFKSGRSGFPKVAHLAASIAGSSATIYVHQRKHGFHVFVPLATLET